LSVVFFTDRDLGLQFPRILRGAGLTVERHADHFPHDCPDDVWLAKTAAEGWVSLTHDSRIRYKPNELAAIVAHRARLLVIVGKAPYPDLARSFVATLDPVRGFLDAHSAPVIGKVYRASAAELSRNPAAPGRVELWYPARRRG
jgi:hypothetical protein